MSRVLGPKGRRDRFLSVFELPDHQGSGVKSRAGADRHLDHRGADVNIPFIVTGMLRWSRRDDFFVETDLGTRWLLDLHWLMTEKVDRLLHSRVVVEGGRIGPFTMTVATIEVVE